MGVDTRDFIIHLSVETLKVQKQLRNAFFNLENSNFDKFENWVMLLLIKRVLVRNLPTLLLFTSTQAFMRRFLVGAKPPTISNTVARAASAIVTTDAVTAITAAASTNPTTSSPSEIHSSSSCVLSASLFSKSIPKDANKLITWTIGENVPYANIVGTFEEISKVSGRIEKENLLSNLFSAVLCSSPNELEVMVYLASNHVHPVYAGLELGVGDSILIKAICDATGRKKDAVEEAYEKEGDLGVVAVQSRTSQKTLTFAAKPKPLMATYVLDQFRQLTQIKGEKAQARKVELIKGLMIRCQGQEAKYIIRALQGKLRIGLAEQTVLVSLAHSLIDCQVDTFEKSSAKASTVENSDIEEGSCSDDNFANTSSDEEGRNSTKKLKKVSKKRPKSSSVRTDVALESASTKAAALQLEETVESKVKRLEEKGERGEEITVDDVLDVIDSVKEKETAEAHKLRQHAEVSRSLPKEKLHELAEIVVKRAFSECPNLSVLLQKVLNFPLHQIYHQCKLQLGIPIAPMLAKPTKQITEVLKRLSNQAFTMEYKYDGERAQIHVLADSESSVKIFSRNSEDNTEKYPDLQSVVR